MLLSKKGKKIKLDRSSWSTYHNFDQMYECVRDEMVAAGIAVELEALDWMDPNGEICEEYVPFGCKVTHNITHPDYAIVLDKVSRNNNQKGVEI